MLDKLIRMFAPTRATDPFFGQLTLMRIARGKPSYWEGEKRFGPLDASAMLFIDTARDGGLPTTEQRDFFRWVEKNFDEICIILEQAFRDDSWTSRVMQGEFREEFTLSSFSIPLQSSPEEEWEMSFESATDPEHLFTATLKGLHVQRIAIDG